MKIHLIRHMQTDWNVLGKLQGVTDTDLSDLGKEKAIELVQRFDIENVHAIYSSDKIRTKFLATRLADKLNLELCIDDDFREVNVGDWTGLTWPEIQVKYKDFLVEWFKDNEFMPMPNGESYAQLLQRVENALNKAVDRAKGDIVVVTHGAVIRALVCKVRGIPLRSRGDFDIDNGSITTIDFNHGKMEIECLNMTY
jgi:broad specificity phosphatase PhoE